MSNIIKTYAMFEQKPNYTDYINNLVVNSPQGKPCVICINLTGWYKSSLAPYLSAYEIFYVHLVHIDQISKHSNLVFPSAYFNIADRYEEN